MNYLGWEESEHSAWTGAEIMAGSMRAAQLAAAAVVLVVVVVRSTILAAADERRSDEHFLLVGFVRGLLSALVHKVHQNLKGRKELINRRYNAFKFL
jgi:hypothetical protein